MTYTKQVREYCETHKGTLIDISKVKDEEFADIPYKTLLNIIHQPEGVDLIPANIELSRSDDLFD